MDVAVLLLFALFFTALVVTTTSRYDVLRGSIRRPRVFQLAAVGAAAVTVPIDVYAVGYDAFGPTAVALQDVSGRLLLLNVAAACGLAALHSSLRPAIRMGVLRWVGPLSALVVVAAVVALAGGNDALSSGNDALSSGNDALSSGNGSGSAGVGSSAGGAGSTAGSALAVYSLLVCLISASSLFRRRTRSAIDPQEG